MAGIQRVYLLGLDFGSTTSSAVAASAVVRRNAVAGRMELCELEELFRSSMIMTPFVSEGPKNVLDLARIEKHLDNWLASAGLTSDQLFGGGALLTGLAAQADNAAQLVALVRRRLRDALVASADDPRLESWLAFMGNCAGLSRANSDLPIVNLDIGGGTTNLALGLAGEVCATGSLFVGARHFQVVPGSYRIVRLTSYAESLLEHLGLKIQEGDDLKPGEVERILDYYVGLLEDAVSGTVRPPSEVDAKHVQVAFIGCQEVSSFSEPERRRGLNTLAGARALTDTSPPRQQGTPHAVTLSGGVGELVYRHMRGEPWPGTTAFGDLGVDLSRRLAASPLWTGHWRRLQPDAGGRATVFGLLRHSTHVSGSTVFLPHPEDLPLRDVPIVGTLSTNSSDEHLCELARLARAAPRGACLKLLLPADSASIKSFAQRLNHVLQREQYPPGKPLVLLVAQNIGKVFGQYLTAWGSAPLRVTVIDEIADQDAQFVHLGALHEQVIPVSFFGLR